MNKICTSIEQSKKLIELGIDVNTADMFYADLLVNGNHKYNLHPLESYNFKTFGETKLKTSEHLDFIPAWSASELLEIIRNNGRYELQMYEGGYYFEANGFITESYFNPVDACVKMIIRLHELNLL